jgi:hypothetical protein
MRFEAVKPTHRAFNPLAKQANTLLLYIRLLWQTAILVLSIKAMPLHYDDLQKHLLLEGTVKKQRNKPNRLSGSEVMTIPIAFHLSGMRNLKHFYLFCVRKHTVKEFPGLVSYNRFFELQQKTVLPPTVFLKTCRTGSCTGISFTDSTALKVCRIKREHQHRVFECIASKGKSTPGRFFGFNLHIIINDKGEIISFVMTRGNVDDRRPLSMESFIRHVR